MIFKRLLLLIVGLAAIQSVYANSFTLKGKILSKDKQSPIAYATISLLPLNKHTITDERGEFVIQEIPQGDYQLIAQSIEITTLDTNIVIPQSQQTILYAQHAKAQTLSEVKVIGKNTTDKIKDQGYSVDQVDFSKWEKQSVMPTELLDRSVGVKIRQTGGHGSDLTFNINGLSGNAVRIFIDGAPIKSYGSGFSLSTIPTEMIDRIEVYKGVVPAHLGEDALGGAINIILKKENKSSLRASYSIGSFNTHIANLAGGFYNKDTGLFVNASGFFTHSDNSYKVWGDEIYITDPKTGKNSAITAKRFHDAFQSKGTTINTGIRQRNWADLLSLSLLYNDVYKEIQHGATMEVVYGNRHSKKKSYVARLEYQKRALLPFLSVNGLLSYSYSPQQTIDTIADQYNWNGERLKDPNGDYYQWNKGGGEAGKATLQTNNDHTLHSRIGMNIDLASNHDLSFNYLRNALKRSVDDPLLPQVEQQFLDTRYVTKSILSSQYNWLLNQDRTNISAFYKLYHQKVKLTDPYKGVNGWEALNIDRKMLNHGFGGVIRHNITQQLTLSASAEKAIRLPENYELLGNEASNIDPSYDLKPEESINMNLGATWTPIIAQKHFFSIEANLFSRNVTNLITRKITLGLADKYAYENLGSIKSYGIDFNVNYRYKQKLEATIAVSNFNARFNERYDSHGTEYVYYNDRLRNTPYLTSNGNIQYHINNLFLANSRLSLNYNLSYVHEFFRNWESLGGTNKAIIPSQTSHDIGFTYLFPNQKLSISGDIKNISNQQHYDNWALQKPGRSFHTKISYTIF